MPGASQDEKDILAKVIFHTMPKVAATGDLTLSNIKSEDASGKSEAPKKEEGKEKPIEKSVERPSLAPPAPPPPPTPPKPAVTPPPLLTGAPPAPHGAAKILPVAPSGSKKLFFIIIGVVILLFAGGGGWYWYRTTRASDTTDRGALTLSPGTVLPGKETAGTESDAVPPVVTSPESLAEHFLADRGFISTRDSDADLLTDAEEALYGTDPELPDTDRDGWPDGWELVHLYDPAQGQAKRLTDNAQLTAFQNEDYGYALLYPKQWVVQSVDQSDSSEVVVTSETGEFLRITAEPYGDHAFGTLEEAYLRNKYPGGSTYTLHPLTNKFNVRGFETADGLTVFLEGKNTLYVMRYEPGLRTEINFKRTMAMFVAGFLVNEEVPPAIRSQIYNPGVPGFAQAELAPDGSVTTTPALPPEETATSSPVAAPFSTSPAEPGPALPETSPEEGSTTSSKL